MHGITSIQLFKQQQSPSCPGGQGCLLRLFGCVPCSPCNMVQVACMHSQVNRMPTLPLASAALIRSRLSVSSLTCSATAVFWTALSWATSSLVLSTRALYSLSHQGDHEVRVGCQNSVSEAELIGEHGHLHQSVVMHRQQQATLSQLLEGACLALITASQACQLATALETHAGPLARVPSC